MRLLTKASIALAALLVWAVLAPAAKADPIVIQTGGFSLQNLGNNGTGVSGLDSLVGAASSQNINGTGSFTALLNPLTFTTGFTGTGSGGQTYLFNFSQLLTINGQTQTINLAGSIDISQFVDTVHILSAAPLTFNFNTFSVAVNLIPTDIVGNGEGVFTGALNANFAVTSACNPVPEPATLTLLGLGLAGAAAKLRQRRKPKKA
jgi:hypothetical protein